MIMKPGLPGEMGVDFTHFKRGSSFIPSNDSGNIIVDHWIFIACDTTDFIG